MPPVTADGAPAVCQSQPPRPGQELAGITISLVLPMRTLRPREAEPLASGHQLTPILSHRSLRSTLEAQALSTPFSWETARRRHEVSRSARRSFVCHGSPLRRQELPALCFTEGRTASEGEERASVKVTPPRSGRADRRQPRSSAPTSGAISSTPRCGNICRPASARALEKRRGPRFPQLPVGRLVSLSASCNMKCVRAHACVF